MFVIRCSNIFFYEKAKRVCNVDRKRSILAFFIERSENVCFYLFLAFLRFAFRERFWKSHESNKMRSQRLRDTARATRRRSPYRKKKVSSNSHLPFRVRMVGTIKFCARRVSLSVANTLSQIVSLLSAGCCLLPAVCCTADHNN